MHLHTFAHILKWNMFNLLKVYRNLNMWLKPFLGWKMYLKNILCYIKIIILWGSTELQNTSALLQNTRQIKQCPKIQGTTHCLKIKGANTRLGTWCLKWKTKHAVQGRQCTIAIGVHPPRTCLSLKNHFSAPNHCTDMKHFVWPEH